MDNKKIEQNYETILDSEIAKAESGDFGRRRLLEYAELVLRCEKISAEYSRIASSRDKEEVAASWSYAENKKILIELELLEMQLAKLQNRINKLSGKKNLSEEDMTRLQRYHSDYMLAEAQMINLQNPRHKEEIERVNKAIKSYVNDVTGLDLSFEEIKKVIASLSKEEKKKFILRYASIAEKLKLLTEADLTSAQTFGE